MKEKSTSQNEQASVFTRLMLSGLSIVFWGILTFIIFRGCNEFIAPHFLEPDYNIEEIDQTVPELETKSISFLQDIPSPSNHLENSFAEISYTYVFLDASYIMLVGATAEGDYMAEDRIRCLRALQAIGEKIDSSFDANIFAQYVRKELVYEMVRDYASNTSKFYEEFYWHWAVCQNVAFAEYYGDYTQYTSPTPAEVEESKRYLEQNDVDPSLYIRPLKEFVNQHIGQ